MQDLESWASRATTIVSSYTNLPSTSFSDFKSEFSELFAEEAIQDLPSEEEGLIAKILQAFQELLYFGTNFQFFRPATLRADIYDVTQAKDILTEISLT